MADSQPTAQAEAPATPSYMAVPDRDAFREALDRYVKARLDMNIAWMSLGSERFQQREQATQTYLHAREVLWGLAGLTPDPWMPDEV